MQITSNNKILILIPHQDDELNVAGDLITQFVQSGNRVFTVFTTNGDYRYLARTRMQEAVNALAVMGVPKEDIFFLGYGDTLNGHGHPHIFNATEKIVSPAGYTHTYGTDTFPDYAFSIDGLHHDYTKTSYQCDLKKIICEKRPDCILSVDYDVHADHRMTSISFEEVMGQILSCSQLNYQPIVYKAFAYSTGFNAECDFYALNLLETKKPIEGKVPHYYRAKDLLDSSIYLWEKRIRFPLLDENLKHFLFHNRLFKAFCCHKSQFAGFHAAQVINSDKVFWQRRTDSVSYRAKVAVSSNVELAHYLTDFHLYNTDDIDSEIPVFNHYLWYPASDDNKCECHFKWPEKQHISQIVLYGSLSPNILVHALSITLNDTKPFTVGPLPAHGRPLIIDLPKTEEVYSCTIKLLDIDTGGGISECEFYHSSKQKNDIIHPFIKIIHNDNFIYKYLVPDNVAYIQLDTYFFECAGDVIFKIVGDSKGASLSSAGLLLMKNLSGKIKIIAYLKDNPSICDEISIYKILYPEMLLLKSLQFVEKNILTLILRLNRKYMYLRKKYINDI